MNDHNPPAHDAREVLRKALLDQLCASVSLNEVDLIIIQLWIEGYMLVPVHADIRIECTH